MERLRQRPASRAAFEQTLADVAETLRRDPTVAVALSSVLTDPATDPWFRDGLLNVFLESDDASALRAVLAAARADLDQIGDDWRTDREARSRVVACLEGLQGHRRLAEMEGDPNLLELLEWGSRHNYERIGAEVAGPARIDLMLSAPVDAKARSHLLSNMFLYPGGGARTNCRTPLELINEEDRARLRRSFEQWTGELRDYPGGAVMALVMLGDEATITLLREWSVSDRLEDERWRAGFAQSVILGESYHDPAAALRYIRSFGTNSASELVVCAMTNAARLGVSRADLRAALFERERSVDEYLAKKGWTERARRGSKSDMLWRIKEAALELRLLDPEEWPLVKAPRSMREMGVTP